MNENRIFKHYYVIDRMEIDCSVSNVFAVTNINKLENVSSIANFPKETFYNESVLQVISKNVAACDEKVFAINFNALNLIEKNVLTFGYNNKSDCSFLKITLFNSVGDNYSTTITTTGDRWNYILIDISNCPFLSQVNGIVFSLSGKNSDLFNIAVQQFSCVAFGNILDLSFEKGNAANYFLSTNQQEPQLKNNSLVFSFASGDELLSPLFSKPRYTELNMPLSVKDTICLTIKNNSDCDKIKLFYTTDKNTQFNESRSFELDLLKDDRINTYLVPIASAENERLLQFKLAPQNGKGELFLFKCSFTQENDSLNDEIAFNFLAKPKLKVINKYSFSIKGDVFNVLDFGAKGDGYTCDNSAIQAAINFASKCGGGKVVLGENKRFIASHLQLKSNVELCIDKGAILLQAENAKDYPYNVEYEHDNIYSTVNWAHNCLVNNKPLIYATNAHNIKISGEGKIRCADSGNEKKAVGFPYWPIHCPGTLHVMPLGFNNCDNLEISDITINRSSTYHCFLTHCENIFINNIKFFDVRCLSADGIGLAGSKNVTICNSLIQTNDDGVTLCSLYNDPRAGGWWKSTILEDNSVRNVEVFNCYINSKFGGEGKAISFIPWGTDSPNIENQEIDNISIHDNILNGGFSVGAWGDNPYNGKQPFDNTETNDFSPVQNITIVNNRYLSEVSLGCVNATNVLSDKLFSSKSLINGDFKNGLSNFTYFGNARLEVENSSSCVVLTGVSQLFQGLYCNGKVKFSFRVSGIGTAFINSDSFVNEEFFCAEKELVIALELKEFTSIQVGVKTDKTARIMGVKQII